MVSQAPQLTNGIYLSSPPPSVLGAWSMALVLCCCPETCLRLRPLEQVSLFLCINKHSNDLAMGNNTQKAAIALEPLTTHPEEWA